MVAQIAVAAVELQAAVDRVEAGMGRRPLGHGREPRGRALAPIERRGRSVEHQARRLELGCIVCDAEAERLEIREAGAELLALLHIGDSALEAELRTAERAGRDIEAPAIEPAHGDLEALSFGADAVRNRDAARLQDHHGGRLRMPAEVFLLRAEGAPGGAVRDQETGESVPTPSSRAR